MGRKSNQQIDEKVNQEQIDLFIKSVCTENEKLDKQTIQTLIITGLITKLKIQQYNVCYQYRVRMECKAKGSKSWAIVKEIATDFDLSNEAVSYILKNFQRIVFAF